MDKKFIELWEQITDMGIATDEEIGLCVALMGRSVETLNNILYVRTGYNSIEQLCEEEEA